MPEFDVGHEGVTAFEVGQAYLFKGYFNHGKLYDWVKKYKKNDKFAFEVFIGDVNDTWRLLDEYNYKLKTEDYLSDYCALTDGSSDTRKSSATQS